MKGRQTLPFLSSFNVSFSNWTFFSFSSRICFSFRNFLINFFLFPNLCYLLIMVFFLNYSFVGVIEENAVLILTRICHCRFNRICQYCSVYFNLTVQYLTNRLYFTRAGRQNLTVSSPYMVFHGLRTPNEAFFHWNPDLFGLGR